MPLVAISASVRDVFPWSYIETCKYNAGICCSTEGLRRVPVYKSAYHVSLTIAMNVGCDMIHYGFHQHSAVD
jgi:hypothetical protein